MTIDATALLALDRDRPEPTAEDVAIAIKLAAEQATLLDEIAAAELELKTLKRRLEVNVTQALPEALNRIYLKKLPTNRGTVELKPVVAASPKKENQPGVIAWLEEHGQAAVVKTQLDLRFAMGEHKMLKKALSVLRTFPAFKGKLEVKEKKSVHPSALDKTVREWLQAELDVPGTDKLPRDLFGVFEGVRAELKLDDHSLRATSPGQGF